MQRNRIHVKAGQRIGGVILPVVLILIDGKHSAGSQEGGAGPEVQRIESRAKVDEERIVNSTREDRHAIWKVVNALLSQRCVVGHGPRTNVGGYRV